MTKPEPILALDRARGVVHKRSCPVLLLLDDASVESYEGLEHALRDDGVSFCSCTMAFLARAIASVWTGLAQQATDETELAALTLWVRNIRETADMFDRSLVDSALPHVSRTDGETRH